MFPFIWINHLFKNANLNKIYHYLACVAIIFTSYVLDFPSILLLKTAALSIVGGLSHFCVKRNWGEKSVRGSWACEAKIHKLGQLNQSTIIYLKHHGLFIFIFIFITKIMQPEVTNNFPSLSNRISDNYINRTIVWAPTVFILGYHCI